MKNLAIGILLCLLMSKSYGVILSPTTLEYNVDHNNSERIILINNSTEQVAIESNIYQLFFDQTGKIDKKVRNSESLLIFPIAVLLQPGDRQVFRLQWISEKKLAKSESYFVRFSQINLKKPNSEKGHISPSVKFQIHYNTLVHIFSSRHSAKVHLSVDDDGVRKLFNDGNRHAYSTQLHFFSDDLKSPIEIRKHIGEHFIPPYSQIELDGDTSIPAGLYYGKQTN
ncbi:fimbria/pilus periplasmic chaperone [Vibrio sinaloensis]|uniref:fimbria/pilus periplasmic chaperone n=1 Tax=Photobacterium sp. (strain ATCC 43367) TaxID=379097 RepID=UPI00057D5865|nr:fimbria/pilus periplasmic chaperone [Vibrio sinaloensis]KHT40284.1 hypothetical protein RJ47_15165 [Vibrio sinaloensis]